MIRLRYGDGEEIVFNGHLLSEDETGGGRRAVARFSDYKSLLAAKRVMDGLGIAEGRTKWVSVRHDEDEVFDNVRIAGFSFEHLA